jgi:hypothetical protein
MAHSAPDNRNAAFVLAPVGGHVLDAASKTIQGS